MNRRIISFQVSLANEYMVELDKNGNTPLIAAILKCSPSAVRNKAEQDKTFIELTSGWDSDIYEEIGRQQEISDFLSKVYESALSDVTRLIRAGCNVNQPDKNGNTPLMIAASSGIEIAALIEAGAVVNAKNKDGQTALMFAAKSFNNSAVKCLIKSNAIVDVQDNEGNTALLHANGERSKGIFYLIEAGANVNAKNMYGKTALMSAAERGNNELVCHLIKSGAIVDAQDNEDRTALMYAAFYSTDLIDALIEAGANINHRSRDGSTFLMKAAQGGGSIKRLIELGANINAQNILGETVLMKAAISGQTTSLQELISAGVEINARDNNGETALMKAATSRQLVIVTALIEAGAEVDAQDKKGETALMKAAYQRFKGLADNCKDDNVLNFRWIIKRLLGRGSDVNARDNNGETALMKFAGVRFQSFPLNKETGLVNFGAELNKECISEFINAGAEVDAQDNNGETALMKVAASSVDDFYGGRLCYEILETLIRLNANPNIISNNGESALTILTSNSNSPNIDSSGAEQERQRCCLISMIGAKADVNHKNSDGNTALLLASANGFYSPMNSLIIAKANVNLVNNLNQNALTRLLYVQYAPERFEKEVRGSRYAIPKEYYGDSRVVLLIRSGVSLRTKDVYGKSALTYIKERYRVSFDTNPIRKALFRRGVAILSRGWFSGPT